MSEILTISLLMVTIRAAIPLLYATLGELLTERSGVINLGIEGIMAVGSVVGFAAGYYAGNAWIGIAAALFSGAILGFVHSLLVITFQANQVVAGLVEVLTYQGVASFFGQRLGPSGKSLVGLRVPEVEVLALPGILRQDLLIYFCFLLLLISWIYLYKTRPGLELRAVGEAPNSADSSGINIVKTRYIHTIVGSALMAVAGAYLSLAFSPGWSDGMTGGRGWIAIGLVIVSRWNPLIVILGAMLFGGINAFQYRLQAVGTTVPSALLRMLPYMAAIVVLVLATYLERRHKAEPSSLGKVYTRE